MCLSNARRMTMQSEVLWPCPSPCFEQYVNGKVYGWPLPRSRSPFPRSPAFLPPRPPQPTPAATRACLVSSPSSPDLPLRSSSWAALLSKSSIVRLERSGRRSTWSLHSLSDDSILRAICLHIDASGLLSPYDSSFILRAVGVRLVSPAVALAISSVTSICSSHWLSATHGSLVRSSR